MNDIDELTGLNRDYVVSVQNSDVKRFDEILADDFYCTNPDMSLVDRAGFLKQTAVPVTIKNLEPHDVKIRWPLACGVGACVAVTRSSFRGASETSEPGIQRLSA